MGPRLLKVQLMDRGDVTKSLDSRLVQHHTPTPKRIKLSLELASLSVRLCSSLLLHSLFTSVSKVDFWHLFRYPLIFGGRVPTDCRHSDSSYEALAEGRVGGPVPRGAAQGGGWRRGHHKVCMTPQFFSPLRPLIFLKVQLSELFDCFYSSALPEQ